jgi:microcystin-dependent protein
MTDYYLGEVRAFPSGVVPRGWLACQGQLLPVNDNAALSSLLGTAYGGDGISTFALPKLDPLPAASGTLQYCIATQGFYPKRP